MSEQIFIPSSARAVLLRAGIAATSLALPVAAFSATPTETAKTNGNEVLEEVIVTGTLVRGLAPGGTSVISVNKADIKETGAVTTSQLLATIPQFGSFNDLQRPTTGGNFSNANRPNLRNLPGFSTNGSSPTLMLIDGHRVVGAGASSTSPDADYIPPGVIERVEIVSDGGSAIYGSDAVAGVVNFITRKDIDGVEVNARHGFADNYETNDANLLAGKTWDGGGIYAAYSFSKNDQILGRDRDFVRTFPTNRLAVPYTAIECPVGNVNPFQTASVYGLPFTTATAASKLNQPSQCDLTDYVSLYPEQKRSSLFAGLNLRLADWLEFNTKAFLMDKKAYQSLGLSHETRLLASAPVIPGVAYSPYVASHQIGPGPVELQNVSYAWGDDNSSNQRIHIQAWGVVPELTAELGGGWRGRLLGNYGRSNTLQHSASANTSALAAAIPTGLFNPYDPTSSDPATLAAIRDTTETFGQAKQTQMDFRLVFDGELFSLPGGGIKTAIGVEYLGEKLRTQRGNGRPGYQTTGAPAFTVSGSVNGVPASFVVPAAAPIAIYNLKRNVRAAFGELALPIFSSQNAKPALRELTVSASGRYDKYSDFGGTFNPRYGITWKPLDWMAFRGAWGKNFSAPSLVDDTLADPLSIFYFGGPIFSFLVPTSALLANGFPAPTIANSNGLVFQGTKPGLKPQTAKTWSLGWDVSPPIIPGLTVGASYFNLTYEGLIGYPPFTDPSTWFSQFKDQITLFPSQAQIDAAVAAAKIINGSNCTPSPACVYLLEDASRQNVGGYKVSGIDFNASYVHQMGFGSIDFSVAGTYEMDRSQSPNKGSPFVGLLADNTSRFRMVSSVGTQIKGLRAQVSWKHSAGYSLNPVIPAAGNYPIQDKVDAFDVFDLFLNYDLNGEGILKDLSVSLTVNNLFDTDPPEYRAQNISLGLNGYANGNTLGRLIQVGVAKKF